MMGDPGKILIAARHGRRLRCAIMPRDLSLVLALSGLTWLAGCGGGGAGTQPTGTPPTPAPTATPPAATPVQFTESFSGTTTQSGPGACGGDSHNVVAAEGEMSVRLVATSDPAAALSVQVCAGGIDNRDCTINQQKIAVGQTLGGARKGGAAQNLKLLPHSCVFGGPMATAPVTYTAALTYMK